MLKAGITGGIGTGKSYVCAIFKVLGVPVYDADLRAKQLVNESKTIQEKIISTFGPGSFSAQGEYQRKFISQKIFQNPELKLTLEHILHPAVKEDSLRWFAFQETQHHLYALKEAALLFESGSYIDLDKIIVVDAPMELRITRLMLRDGLDEMEIRSRIDSQWPQELKLARADFVIQNDGNSPLIPRVWAIHHQLLHHAAVSLQP
jgi:dephospho-CoA kinase